MKRQFYLYARPTRKLKNGKPVMMYYCQFVDETGKRMTAVSTGETSKGAAEGWAQKKLKTGRPSRETLDGFAKGFFDWETSAWIKRQHAYDRPFSKAIALARKGQLDNYILPEFGKQRLDQLNRAEIEDWIVGLDLSNQTKNHILYTFRIVLREAQIRQLIASNPLEKVNRLGTEGRTRDVFTLEELLLMFPDNEEKMIEIWGDMAKATAMLILASTGIRSGELRALLWDRVIDGKALYIDQAVRNDQTVGPVTGQKGGARMVLLPKKAQTALSRWREKAPWDEPGDLIFASEKRGRPQTRHWLSATFGEALARAKVKADGRVLVVHSLRHTYNTRMRKVLPEEMLRLLTGHHSEAMTDRYDHPSTSDMIERLAPAEKLIDKVFAAR